MANTTQGTQVTLTIPEGAPPGTLLSVPVRGGQEQIKVRVPAGLGPGSTLIMTQPEGTEEWGMKVGKVVPTEEGSVADGGDASLAPQPLPAIHPSSPAGASMGNPAPALDSSQAYTVRLDTTVGSIDIIVRPDWAPLGTRRFLELAASGDLTELAFYRAIKGCIVQFGLPAKRNWPCIPDDPPTGVPFLLGAVSFAAIGENTRRSTLFICVGDMSHMLGQKSWETPIGAVAESSLDILENIDTSYGDIAEFGGTGPDTSRINAEGSSYLKAEFPRLSYIRSARPLNWPPPNESAPLALPEPGFGAASRQSPTAANVHPPPPAPPGSDPAVIAAHASQTAQWQAGQASSAAADAERSRFVEDARRAAQSAQAAAAAAQVAADEARTAAEAMKAALARAEQQAAQSKKLVAIVGTNGEAAPPSASAPSASAPAAAGSAAFVGATAPVMLGATAPAVSAHAVPAVAHATMYAHPGAVVAGTAPAMMVQQQAPQPLHLGACAAAGAPAAAGPPVVHHYPAAAPAPAAATANPGILPMGLAHGYIGAQPGPVPGYGGMVVAPGQPMPGMPGMPGVMMPVVRQ